VNGFLLFLLDSGDIDVISRIIANRTTIAFVIRVAKCTMLCENTGHAIVQINGEPT